VVEYDYIYGQVLYGCYGRCINKLNIARRIWQLLSPWLSRCWHQTTYNCMWTYIYLFYLT